MPRPLSGLIPVLVAGALALISPCLAQSLVGFSPPNTDAGYTLKTSPFFPASGRPVTLRTTGGLLYTQNNDQASKEHYGGLVHFYTAWMWRGSGPLERLPLPQVVGISPQGDAIGGNTVTYDPFDGPAVLNAAWVISGTQQPLTGGESHGLSGDGQILVGGDTPSRWLRNGTLETLGGGNGTAYAANQDGSVIVGRNNGVAFRWTSAGGLAPIIIPGPFPESLAADVSSDGFTVVGRTFSPAISWIWTASRGVDYITTKLSVANAISDDGSTVVGGLLGRIPQAYLWTRARGLRTIRDLLEDRGVSTAGWALWEATAVNEDGTVVAGTGFYLGTPATWIARFKGRLSAPEPIVILSNVRGYEGASDPDLQFRTRRQVLEVGAENAQSGVLRAGGETRRFRITRGRWTILPITFAENRARTSVVLEVKGTGGTFRTRFTIHKRR